MDVNFTMSAKAEQIVIVMNHDGAKKEAYVYDSAFATLANEVIDPAEGTDLKISRDQNFLRIQGTLKGEEIKKDVEIDDQP